MRPRARHDDERAFGAQGALFLEPDRTRRRTRAAVPVEHEHSKPARGELPAGLIATVPGNFGAGRPMWRHIDES